MPILRTIAVVVAATFAASVAAAPATFQVVGQNGRPVAGAIVTLAVNGVPAPPVKGPYRMSQHDIAFEPHVLIVPVGAIVSFPNLDRVRHHVYSFSPAKKFNLKLFGRDETRSVTFDKAGAVTLGCNIHDSMNGIVFVTATPFTAITDQDGKASFASVPNGRAAVSVWDPAIRKVGNTITSIAMIGANTTTQLRLP